MICKQERVCIFIDPMFWKTYICVCESCFEAIANSEVVHDPFLSFKEFCKVKFPWENDPEIQKRWRCSQVREHAYSVKVEIYNGYIAEYNQKHKTTHKLKE